ncbi:MAG: hypothetical protein HY235_02545 [Acidobacteria bacterium]|nr:hypothetical protein [Acidobacteriota bacterium]
MSVFWENATRLLDAALSAARAGRPTESMTVLIGAEGGIHILAGNDWPLDRLASDRGVPIAYRVHQRQGRITVEGHTANGSCYLESRTAEPAARRLLRDQPMYSVDCRRV